MHEIQSLSVYFFYSFKLCGMQLIFSLSLVEVCVFIRYLYYYRQLTFQFLLHVDQKNINHCIEFQIKEMKSYRGIKNMCVQWEQKVLDIFLST